MALSLLTNLTKLGIAGGAIYITLDQGIWRGPGEGAVNFNRLTHTIPNQERIVTQLPSRDNVTTSAKQTWNTGVHKAFGGLATLPDKASQGSERLVNYVKDSSSSK
ncbi:MICOS complex subunit MIC13-like [Amphiura filiformis]|uniref:MICOS complex subunit MIC13-like n=1 Tax=Amphiura filiformis TaxID=82378 RepID=UPI003B22781D